MRTDHANLSAPRDRIEHMFDTDETAFDTAFDATWSMVSTVERRRHLDQLSLEWIGEVAELDATGAHLRDGYTAPTAF